MAKKKSLKQLVTFIITIAMVFVMPFSSMTVNAGGGDIILTEDVFAAAKADPGNPHDGVVYSPETASANEGFEIQAGSYALGGDINSENECWIHIGGAVELDLGEYSLGDNLPIGVSGSNASLAISGNGKVGGRVGAYDSSNVSISGGKYALPVYAHDGSSLSISGGEFADEVYTRDEKSSLTVSDGTFAKDVYAKNGAKLTIDGGSFGSAYANAENDYSSADLIINGGTFTDYVGVQNGCNITITAGDFKKGATAENSNSVSVSGGTFVSGTFGFFLSDCKTVKISGGSFSGTAGGFVGFGVEDLELSGGTFTATAKSGSTIPLSGILISCNGEEKAKDYFFKVIKDGYEYSPAIQSKYLMYNPISGDYFAFTDQKTVSVVKSSPVAPVDPVDPGDDKGGSDKKDDKKYSNEWVDGKWYDADGKQTYDGILSWKQNETGWWVEDTKGWYPTSTWQKIDGKWYYFCADGYMDYSEYRDGCWLGDDGAWVEDYYGGHWMSDATGWWYEDASGWYPVSRWLWIDGSCYYFEASGYMATSKYVDGYWVGADGAWVK